MICCTDLRPGALKHARDMLNTVHCTDSMRVFTAWREDRNKAAVLRNAHDLLENPKVSVLDKMALSICCRGSS